VLFLGRDDFIAWELRGAVVDTPLLNFYNVGQPPSRFKLGTEEEKFDFDSVPSGVLDRYRYVVTTTSAYASEPPGNFTAILTTPSYVLWKRHGPTHRRETLHELSSPGAVLHCTHGDAGRPENHGIAQTATLAAVWARPPVAGPEADWTPSATAAAGAPATQTLRLSPGRWQISLAYDSPRPLTVEAAGPGLAEMQGPLLLPANLDFRGPTPPFPAGTLRVVRSGPVTFKVMLAEAPLAGRLLGATGEAHLRTLSAAPLAPIRHVTPRRACGRYVDWLRVPNR
jgi:hypothetical protein